MGKFNYRTLDADELERLAYCGDAEAVAVFVEKYSNRELIPLDQHEESIEDAYRQGYEDGLAESDESEMGDIECVTRNFACLQQFEIASWIRSLLVNCSTCGQSWKIQNPQLTQPTD